MAYFDERLKELHRQKLQKKRLQAMELELERQRAEAGKKAAELNEIKEKEQLDVDKLEGKSIKSLFATLAGNKDEKLSQERQEAYAAAMKYDAALRDLQGIMRDLEHCKIELENIEGIEEEYEHLLEERKNSLKQEASRRANEVIILEKQMEDLSHEIVELEEALDVGYRAFDLIETILKELNEAYNWAETDVFMDSFWVDMQKHEHIHTAQDLIQDLRDELRRFKTELADVSIEGDIQIEIDDFSEFADWFFDNIFTDWEIRDKITNSISQADDTRGQIVATINLLKDMRDERMKRRIELEEDLEAVIVGE